MKYKDPLEITLAGWTKTIRTMTRLDYSIQADEAIQKAIPAFEAEFWDRVSRGYAPALDLEHYFATGEWRLVPLPDDAPIQRTTKWTEEQERKEKAVKKPTKKSA